MCTMLCNVLRPQLKFEGVSKYYSRFYFGSPNYRLFNKLLLSELMI